MIEEKIDTQGERERERERGRKGVDSDEEGWGKRERIDYYLI